MNIIFTNNDYWLYDETASTLYNIESGTPYSVKDGILSNPNIEIVGDAESLFDAQAQMEATK